VAEACFDIDALRKNPVRFQLASRVYYTLTHVVRTLVRSSSCAHVRWDPWSRPHVRLPARIRWKWYKSLDAMVTEVRPLSWSAEEAELSRSVRFLEETVLNDSTGLHMGAGTVHAHLQQGGRF
jgi:hypothetical protein